jgi:hypothetical protein
VVNRSSRQNPCFVCGDEDTSCLTKEDGLIVCFKGESYRDSPPEGYRYIKPAKDDMGAIFAPVGSNGNGHKPRVEQIGDDYIYVDRHGQPYLKVCRYYRDGKKQFSQSHLQGDQWVKGLPQGLQRIPYRLPEVIAADLVLVVEGEKDCLTSKTYGLEKLLGAVTTTNPQGAGKWPLGWGKRYFTGKNVVKIPDHDEAGEKHAQMVAADLRGHAAKVVICRLPGLPEKGDLTDFLEGGGTIEQVVELIREALEAPETEQPEEARAFNTAIALDTGDYVARPQESIVERLVLARSITVFIGPTKTFKTLFAAKLAVCLSKGEAFYGLEVHQSKVLYVQADVDHARMQDQLDVVDPNWRQRKQIALPIIENLPSKRFQLPADAAILREFVILARAGAKRLVLFLDTFRRLAQDGIDQDKNKDVSGFMGWLYSFAQELDIAVVLVHHSNKGGRRGSGAGAFESDCQIEVLINRVREKEAPKREFLWFRNGATRSVSFGEHGKGFYFVPPPIPEDHDGLTPPCAPVQELGRVSPVSIINPYDDDGAGQAETVAHQIFEFLKAEKGRWFYTREVADRVNADQRYTVRTLQNLAAKELIHSSGVAPAPMMWSFGEACTPKNNVHVHGLDTQGLNSVDVDKQITESTQVHAPTNGDCESISEEDEDEGVWEETDL